MSGQEIVNYAQAFKGVPYVFGGTSPRGFDCSGFVQYVYKHFGHVLSRTTKEQINNGREVGRAQLQLADLVFPHPGHVTLYIGNDFVVHAPKPGQCVKVEKLWAFWRARRIIGDEHPQPLPQPIPQNIQQQYKKIPPQPSSKHNSVQDRSVAPGPYPIKTILHPTINNFEFLMGDYNNDGYADLYCIKKRFTGSNSIEVHILSGKSNYQRWLLQTGTPHPEAGDDTTFALGDYNRNGILDLYCIEKRGNGKLYLNILKGESKYKEYIMNVPTGVDELGDNFDFAVADFVGNGMPDFYCMTKYNEPNTESQVFMLKGDYNYQALLMDTRSIIKPGYDNCSFGIIDYAGHGKKDLYCIRRRPNNIGFEVVDGRPGKLFRVPLMETSFKCDSPQNYSFVVYRNQIFAIKGNGDNCTEVHLIKDYVQ